MSRNARLFTLVTGALLSLAAAVLASSDSKPYARRGYQLGSTISTVGRQPFPDSTDWPGAMMFFSCGDCARQYGLEPDLEPGADPPEVFDFNNWSSIGVIKGEFYYYDHFYQKVGLWLADAWNWTEFYFFRTDQSLEPVLFYIKTTGSSDAYPRIKSLLRTAYGEPTAVTRTPVQNRMGAVFQNEIVEYRNRSSLMILTKYGRDLRTGELLHIYLPVYSVVQSLMAKEDSITGLKL